MLVLIVILFLLCWGPRLIMNVLVKLGLRTYSTWIYNTRIICNLLSFVHSALNPFVYGFMSSNFRSMVSASFRRKCCCCRANTAKPSMSSSYAVARALGGPSNTALDTISASGRSSRSTIINHNNNNGASGGGGGGVNHGNGNRSNSFLANYRIRQ